MSASQERISATKGFWSFFNNVYNTEVSAIGLSIFRIAFFSIQLFEVIQIFMMKEVIFDYLPFLMPDRYPHTPFLIGWMIVIVAIICGFMTRPALFAHYIATLVFFSVARDFEYHVDYTYIAVNFLALFVPFDKRLSLDLFFSKKREEKVENDRVSLIYYYVIIFNAVALVYFDSIFHKLAGKVWINGLGVWLPASLPQMSWLDLNWLLNMKELMFFLSFLTLFLEAFLIILMWLEPFRLPLLLLGLGLHIGIFFAFPIPLFALAMITIYILFLPPKYYEKASEAIKDFFKDFNFKPWLHYETITIDIPEKIKYTTIRNLFFITTFCLQCLMILISPGFKNKISPGLKDSILNIHHIVQPFFGITPHGVFVDWHYTQADHIFTVVDKSSGRTEFLPFHNKDGQLTGSYFSGRIWADSSFRSFNHKRKYPLGVQKYTAYWAKKNGKDLRNLDLELWYKESKPSYVWKKDYLKTLMNQPWRKVADIQWRNYKFELVPVS